MGPLATGGGGGGTPAEHYHHGMHVSGLTGAAISGNGYYELDTETITNGLPMYRLAGTDWVIGAYEDELNIPRWFIQSAPLTAAISVEPAAEEDMPSRCTWTDEGYGAAVVVESFPWLGDKLAAQDTATASKADAAATTQALAGKSDTGHTHTLASLGAAAAVHKSQHATGGADALTPTDIGAAKTAQVFDFFYTSNNAGVSVTSGVCTWTPPAGTVCMQIDVIGGGSGGGSGCSLISGDRTGGGGGAGGHWSRAFVPTASLTYPLTITVGAGGTGGPSVTSGAGNAGTGGGKSSVVAAGSNYLLYSSDLGVTGGAGGVQGTQVNGGAANGYPGMVAGTGGALGRNIAGNSAGQSLAGAAGGGGGGITSAGVAASGGGSNSAFQQNRMEFRPPSGPAYAVGGGGGAAGLTGGANGSSAGYIGGGGGGGGATVVGYASGAGGNGSSGYVRIICYF